MSSMFAASSSSAVGICTLITAFSSGSSSSAVGNDVEVRGHRRHQRSAESRQHPDRRHDRRIAAESLHDQAAGRCPPSSPETRRTRFP